MFIFYTILDNKKPTTRWLWVSEICNCRYSHLFDNRKVLKIRHFFKSFATCLRLTESSSVFSGTTACNMHNKLKFSVRSAPYSAD